MKWLASLDALLSAPEDGWSLSDTPGRERPEVELAPRPGVRAVVTLPPDGPAGAGQITIYEASPSPPVDYPAGFLFLRSFPFRLTRRNGDPVILQVTGLRNVEESIEAVLLQSAEAGWRLKARNDAAIPEGPVQVQLTFERETRRREVVVSAVNGRGFLVAQDMDGGHLTP